MKISKFGTAATTLAAFGLVVSSPVFASAQMRSAQALPVAGSAGSVRYTANAENAWHCAPAGNTALSLKGKSVQIDEAGRVVLNSQGSAFGCQAAAAGSYQAGPFPWGLFFLFAGGAGLSYWAAKKIIKNDSPG